MKDLVVSPKWLSANLKNSNLILLDTSQQTNKAGTVTKFDQIQIPGARIFDLKKKFSLQTTNLPNMLPAPKQFERECRTIGINNSSKIIVYDNLGIYFSPRVWWMFKTMGHKEVYVLNGGLPSWIEQGFLTEPKKSLPNEKGDFNALFNKNAVQTFECIERNVDSQDHILIDARPADRFNGIAPEPREGLRSGNIPYSLNIPFKKVLEGGKFKSKKKLRELFNYLQIDNRPLIFSCGSGVTACIVLLACELVLKNNKSIYDGSRTEWAERTLNNLEN